MYSSWGHAHTEEPSQGSGESLGWCCSCWDCGAKRMSDGAGVVGDLDFKTGTLNMSD
jgi:hypothetical protein